MKSFLGLVVALGLVSALSTSALGDIGLPDKRSCVAKSEVAGIRPAWHRARIERYTETAGALRETRANGIEVWEYASCRPRDHAVVIVYAAHDGRWLSIGRY